MQELAKIAEAAAGTPAAETPEAQPKPKVPKAGRRGFAAMFFAQKSGCDCGACQLLRTEIDELMTDMMGELAKDDEGTDSQPS